MDRIYLRLGEVYMVNNVVIRVDKMIDELHSCCDCFCCDQSKKPNQCKNNTLASCHGVDRPDGIDIIYTVIKSDFKKRS